MQVDPSQALSGMVNRARMPPYPWLSYQLSISWLPSETIHGTSAATSSFCAKNESHFRASYLSVSGRPPSPSLA